jgi:hypothetical protein
MDQLEEWAKEEFLTVPQLARVIVKRAIATRKRNKPPSSDTSGSKGREGKDD